MKRLRVLITGCNGFVGRHLTLALQEKGYTLGGIDMGHTSSLTGIKYYSLDIQDKEAVRSALLDFLPTHVFHLAAITFVPDSHGNIEQTFQVNLQGTLNILDSLQALPESASFSRFIYVSSAEVYDVHNSSVPFRETSPLHPESPYAISKLTGEYLCEYYEQKMVPSIIVRPFNHTGPGQSEKFVCSDFSRQIALIEKGSQEPGLNVGNLEHAKDFLDVRDVVQAYLKLLDLPLSGTTPVFNIASEKRITIQWILDTLISYSSKNIKVVVDPDKYRPGKSIMYGSYEKLHQATGWQPEVPFEKTLLGLLNWWRSEIE